MFDIKKQQQWQWIGGLFWYVWVALSYYSIYNDACMIKNMNKQYRISHLAEIMEKREVIQLKGSDYEEL